MEEGAESSGARFREGRRWRIRVWTCIESETLDACLRHSSNCYSVRLHQPEFLSEFSECVVVPAVFASEVCGMDQHICKRMIGGYEGRVWVTRRGSHSAAIPEDAVVIGGDVL